MNRTELADYVKRAKKQDAKAIEALYQFTYPNMYALVYHLCTNKNDVEDILQESYISAFSNLEQLEKEEAFVSWLRKTVINAWRMHIRDNVPNYDTTVFEVAEDQLEEWQFGRSLQDVVEISETNREIWDMVQALPENQRVCMVLFYYDEMRIDEIAEALGIPEGSVKSRLHYGRLRLKESMERHSIHSYGNVPGGTLTAPAVEASAGRTMLARILAALEIASDSGTAAAGAGLSVKLALSVAALLTAGGVIGGVAMRPQRKPAETVAPTATRTTVTTAATTVTTATTTTPVTTTTTTAAPATTTTAAPRLFAAFDCEKTEGGVVITGYKGNEPHVVIPETLNGMTVVAIGKNAFKYSNVLQSVSIPSTVRTVGSSAFRECRHLHTVSLGSGVNVIEDAAFLGCAVQSVAIPSNVREIDGYAFAYCTSLTNVQMAEGVERISYAAFRDCPNLRTVTLPASVSIIGDDSFDGAAPDFTIIAPEGTYAYEYASMHHS